MGSPKTVTEISENVSCSRTKLYRKVNLLKSMRLLSVHGVITASGHKAFQYRNKIGKNLILEFDEMTLNLVFGTDVAK